MEDAAAYYPGDQYVDWIGVDGYDRKYPGASAFTSEFGAFYNQWSGHNKPMMVAETGALGANQGPYLQEILQSVPTQYPDFKAIVYFDSNASGGDWTLQGPGLTAFQSLSHSSYFSFSDH